MRFSVGLFDELFGRRVELEVPDSEGRVIRRAVTEKWLARMEAEGKISPVEKPLVQVHMLDPVNGYRLGTWEVGKNVPEETAERMMDPSTGDLYAMTVLRDGEPETHVVTRVLWEEARRKLGISGE